MVQQNTPFVSLLIVLVQLVDTIPVPLPPAPAKRGRGRPSFYSDRLFLKALVIMIVKHLHTPYELLCVLEQPTPEMAVLRCLLTEGGRYPTRRTWERRLKALPDKLPAQIGCLGRHLVELIQPWSECGRAVAADSTILRARGGVWHRKHREAGEVPHLYRYRGCLDQIGVAWVGVRVEVALDNGRGRCLDTTGRSTYPCQPC